MPSKEPLDCPRCHAPSRIIDCRHRKDHKYRRRVCNACDHLFYTKEKAILTDAQFKKTILTPTFGLVCPSCRGNLNTVVFIRTTQEGLRRRRVCYSCGTRFSTLERPFFNTED